MCQLSVPYGDMVSKKAHLQPLGRKVNRWLQQSSRLNAACQNGVQHLGVVSEHRAALREEVREEVCD